MQKNNKQKKHNFIKEKNIQKNISKTKKIEIIVGTVLCFGDLADLILHSPRWR